MAEGKKWLTVQELLEILRGTGMSISQPFVEDGIVTGKFPFAFSIAGNTNRYYISAKKLNEWLAEWAG